MSTFATFRTGTPGQVGWGPRPVGAPAHRRAYRVVGRKRVAYWSCDAYGGSECQGHGEAAAAAPMP